MTAEVHSLEVPISSTRRMGTIWTVVCIIVLSMAHAFLMIREIPHFTAIFQELHLLLPTSTAIVLKCHWLFVGLDCLWPLAAFFVVRQKASVGYIYGILALFLLEAACTVLPLFLPLIRHLEAVGTIP